MITKAENPHLEQSYIDSLNALQAEKDTHEADKDALIEAEAALSRVSGPLRKKVFSVRLRLVELLMYAEGILK